MDAYVAGGIGDHEGTFLLPHRSNPDWEHVSFDRAMR